jgi:pimeloyl-ACP methyl ester carboxylesterase
MSAAPGSAAAYRPLRTATPGIIETREGRLAVTRWGPADGTPILLLHGWMDCGAAFALLADQLPGHWPLLALDWRGYGRSERRVGRYWFPDHVAELEAVLDLVAPGQPARLIGHSMGGTVAMMYAGMRPERIGWVVNIEGFGLPALPVAQFPAHAAAWLDSLRTPAVDRRYRSHEELAAALRQRNPHLPPGHALFLAAAWTRALPDGSLQLLSDPATEMRSPLRYGREELEACWAAVRAPVLMLQGAESAYLARAAGADAPARWDATLARHESVQVAASGHLLPHEQPARVAQEIIRFVAGCEGQP